MRPAASPVAGRVTALQRMTVEGLARVRPSCIIEVVPQPTSMQVAVRCGLPAFF